MANRFFKRIEDEFGALLGYEYDNSVNWNIFVLLDDKYVNLDLSKPIFFTAIEFDKSKFGAIFRRKEDTQAVEKPNIIFNDCRFRIQEAVSFKNFMVEFRNCKSSTNNFSFGNCSDSTIQITNQTSFGSILIKDCTDIELHLKGLSLRGLKLRNVKKIDFKAEKLTEPGIMVSECVFKDFSIYSSKIKNLQFENSEAGFLTLSAVSGGELSLFGKHKVRLGEKRVFEYGYLNILSCNFSNLHLNGTDEDLLIKSIEIKDTSNFTLASLEINSLTIIGTSLSNVLVFSCIIRNLRFLYFKVKENVDFNLGEYGEGGLILDNAILEGVETNPSFLHHFKSIEFKNSSIMGLVAPSFKLVEPETIRRMRGDFEDKIDFCREMNALMIGQNNKHYATIYRALELEFRAKVKDSSLNWFDKVVLNLNYWSNAHGTMPQKAFFWILFLIVLMFGIINLDLALQTGLAYEAGLDFLHQNYSYFIKPFTFLSDIEEGYRPLNSENMNAKFHPVTKGFDFLFKILYAYLLYQFVAAFRKFNK
ncbi:hypothetical protein [Algoriphagus formosus]|uniref:hypothetical protein n=1 Tax=Algoriphagus formosus TaxID=2007308 RepID=UPI000C28F359|nr:hypothetical protein [Algoriphagus formosus]